MDDSIDPVINTSLQKKKSKKKKKKVGGKNDSDVQESLNSDVQEKQPQQTTDRDETIMRTTKCSYCGKNVRQLLRGFKNPEAVIPGPVVCEVCLKTISQQKEEYKPYTEAGEKKGGGYRLARKQPLKETLCNCVACVSKRDNTVNPDLERDAHITQSYWMEIRHIVRCIYRENMRLSAVTTRENIGSEKMRTIVRKLCCRDPHQFFQRLETLAREYLLEVKVRLLEQLSCGFNSPQLAIEFIQMLLDEYSSLCAALPALLYLLEPLEETEYVQQLGVTIELVNKNIFRELIFAESFMSSNLPLIIAQLRLASLSSDPFHRSTADELSQRYNSLDDEMDMIGSVWNSAKDQLKQQQEESRKKEERRAHIEKILSDGESFKKQAKKDQQHQEVYVTTSVQASNEKIKDGSSNNTPQSVPCETTNHKLSLHPSPNQSSIPSNSASHLPTITTTSLSTKHLPTEEIVLEEEIWLSKEQVSEWSKILFKCIKPIGDPEFRITENIATHTITLKIDMTAIDLQHAESICTHEQVNKYEELGMRREEIAEVALKLNAIKHLGINLRIDDLFDEHGFVIVDGSDYHEEREDAVYFVEEGKNSVKGKEKLMEDEVNRSGLVDLQTEKERVIHREKKEMGEGRETDLLQSMTMKIRFMKSVSDEDTRSRLMSNSEQVMFESCDQVQMKLTQLELNTMRLMCTNKCLASNLGIRKRKPNDSITTEERFVHTDAHQPFVGLLLEQGKQAEQMKRDKEERKALAAASSKDHPKVIEGSETSTQSTAAVKVPEQVTDKREPGSVVKSNDVCIPSQTRSCQCFACIGAVAAQITEGSFHPLNPVDPSGSTLSIKGTMTAKLQGVENCEGNTECHKENQSVSNKAEHVWQNWMSTSEISHTPQQDTSSSQDNHAPPDSDHASPDHSPINQCSSNGSEAGSSDVPHSGSSLSSEGTTNTNGGAVTCTNEDHQHHHSGAHKNGSGNGPVKRYCPCCYCELFGQNTPTVPTSHNYTKQRDKMRQKLEKKRKQEHVYCHHQHAHHHHHHEEPPPHSPVDIHQEHQRHYHHHHHHHHPHQEHPLPTPSPPPPTSIPAQASVGESMTTSSQKQEKSLDEILMFIEGKDFNGSSTEVTSTATSSKGKKKKKGKKKSEQEPVSNGHHVMVEPNGTVKKGRKDESKQHTSLHQNGGPPLQKKGYNSQNPVSQNALKTSGKLNSPKQSQRKASKSSGHSNGLLKSSGRSDNQHTLDNNSLSEVDEDYDKELEEFKKLCFSSAPVETRKKLHVSLNMQDILSKIK